MSARSTVALVAVACAFVGVVAYQIGRARADGAPTMNPLTYGGFIDDGGRPVEGTRSITVRLWNAASGGEAVCSTMGPTTPVVGGRWRLTLAAACTTAVQMNPNLWAEVSVDGNAFPRSKVGAVPYAIESGRAAGASGALDSRITSVESRSGGTGSRQVVLGATPDGDAGNVMCASSFVVASNAPAVTITATATGLYRISTLVSFRIAVRARFRVGTGSTVTFLSQPEMSSLFTATGSGNAAIYEGPVSAIARLDAGRSYTFNLEVATEGCTTTVPLTVLAPFVVEQLN